MAVMLIVGDSSVADPGGAGGHGPPCPVKISYKKDIDFMFLAPLTRPLDPLLLIKMPAIHHYNYIGRPWRALQTNLPLLKV